MKDIIACFAGAFGSLLVTVFAFFYPVINPMYYTVQDNQQVTPTRLTGPNCNGVGTVEALTRRNLRTRPELGNSALFTPQRFLEPSVKTTVKGRDSTCKFFLISEGVWVYDEGIVFTPAQVATGTPQRPTVTRTVTITPTATPAPVFLRIRVNDADLGIIEAREGEPITFSVERVKGR